MPGFFNRIFTIKKYLTSLNRKVLRGQVRILKKGNFLGYHFSRRLVVFFREFSLHVVRHWLIAVKLHFKLGSSLADGAKGGGKVV